MKQVLNSFLSKSWGLVLVSVVVAVLSFLVFSALINKKTSEYSGEIASAFLGTVLTVVITALLLRHQTEHTTNAEISRGKAIEEFRVDLENKAKIADLERHKAIEQFKLELESKGKIYDAKVTLYREFFDKFTELLQEETPGDIGFQKLWVGIMKMALVADNRALEPLGDLAAVFQQIKADNKITTEEFEDISQALAAVAAALGRDLRGHDVEWATGELRPRKADDGSKGVPPFEVLEATNADVQENETLDVLSSISFTPKTSEGAFLAACPEYERLFYSESFKYINDQRITVEWGGKGVSVRGWGKRPVLHMFPAGIAKKIRIVTAKITQNRLESARILLDRNNIHNRWSFDPSEIKIDQFKRLLDVLTKSGQREDVVVASHE